MIQLSKLRDLVHSMECDLGLEGLSATERDVLLAIHAHAKPDPSGRMVCHTEEIRKHPTLRRVSQPTFHRTLRHLFERGLIEKGRDRRRGVYMLPDCPDEDR